MCNSRAKRPLTCEPCRQYVEEDPDYEPPCTTSCPMVFPDRDNVEVVQIYRAICKASSLVGEFQSGAAWIFDVKTQGKTAIQRAILLDKVLFVHSLFEEVKDKEPPRE